MVSQVIMMKASDGTMFQFKNAAKRYERGLVLGNKIDNLPVDDQTKEYIANNWDSIRKMIKSAGNVLPNEQVPDVEIIHPKKKKAKKKA